MADGHARGKIKVDAGDSAQIVAYRCNPPQRPEVLLVRGRRSQTYIPSCIEIRFIFHLLSCVSRVQNDRVVTSSGRPICAARILAKDSLYGRELREELV
jgi:hypothetical protein